MPLGNWVSFTKTWHDKSYPAIDVTRPELSAKGKFIVITGGGTGIGKNIAISFAQAGAKSIALLGRRVGKLEEAAAEIRSKATDSEINVLIESVDLSDRAALDAAATSLTRKANGAKVDVLVHSAGVMTQPGLVEGFDEAALRKGLDLMWIAPFNVIQSFAPLLAKDGHFYNISSGIAHIKHFEGVWLYAAVKLAVAKMFDYLQAEHPDWHVVNIQPGVFASDINEGLGVESEDEPELPGNFTVWLSSPEAKFLNGKFVWVNWDVDELKARAEEIEKSSLLRIQLTGVDM